MSDPVNGKPRTGRERKPPRLDPVKSGAKIVAKYPNLIFRHKPDGVVEIESKTLSTAVSDDIAIDAGVGADVWDAIAAIKSGTRHGGH